MEIFGYLCSMLVGVSLGMMGSGGSILTLPIMVYLFHVNPVDATGYNLLVVGITSAIGGAEYVRKKLVHVKTALIFGIPSVISVFVFRKYIMPEIPNPISFGHSFMITKELFIMMIFTLMMIISSYRMIRNGAHAETPIVDIKRTSYLMLAAIGFLSGILTGIVGIGGGFIIIPALVLFGKVPVKMSVGTSLLIIAANSFIGFGGEVLVRMEEINYSFLLMFSAFSITGVFIGFRLVTKILPAQLKKIFGWFVLVTGILIIIKELL